MSASCQKEEPLALHFNGHQLSWPCRGFEPRSPSIAVWALVPCATEAWSDRNLSFLPLTFHALFSMMLIWTKILLWTRIEPGTPGQEPSVLTIIPSRTLVKREGISQLKFFRSYMKLVQNLVLTKDWTRNSRTGVQCSNHHTNQKFDEEGKNFFLDTLQMFLEVDLKSCPDQGSNPKLQDRSPVF